MRMFLRGLIWITLIWVPVSLQAETHDFSAKARPGVNFQKAEFRCWLPGSGQELAGIMVIIPQQNADGRDAVLDSRYQQKCEEWNFALIGCYFEGNADQYYYSEARRGSGGALRDAIREFSDLSGRRELFNAPLVLIGFSAGAQFSYSMACYKPNDVVAFVSDKGVFFTTRPNAGAYDTPGLFLVGEKDETKSMENTTKLFKQARSRRALWAMFTEMGRQHQTADRATVELMLSYLESVVPLRLSLDNPSSTPKNVRSDAGMFLHRNTGEITSRNNRKAESSSEWSWMPDQQTAERFINLNQVTPNPE